VDNLLTFIGDHTSSGEPLTITNEETAGIIGSISIRGWMFVVNELVRAGLADVFGSEPNTGKTGLALTLAGWVRYRQLQDTHAARFAEAATPTKTLGEALYTRDLPAISAEFDRTLEKVEADPADAATAASAIIEATCRAYIAEKNLSLPADQSIGPLWKTVQNDLRIAPTQLLDGDLKRVLGGLASIVAGVGAFRTHAGDAHGRNPGDPKIEPRHGRLVVHAAHTVVAFVLETWQQRRDGR
jgi:hypothetical protein